MRALFATMLGLWCVWNTACAQSAGILSGRVLDAHGKPVADARVYYYPNFMMAWLGVPPDSLPHATTDSQGRYRITGAGPASIFSVVVAFHPELGCNVLRLGTKPPRDVRLEPLKQVTGKVVGVDGKPVVGAQVRLAYVRVGDDNRGLIAPPVPPFITSTDGEGNFQLPVHPKTDALVIACTAPGYEPLEYMSVVNWDRLSKEGLKLTLRPGARITAQLVYAHNGEPVKDYPVVTVPGFSAISDESGRITLDVATGSVTLAPGFSLSSPALVPPGFFNRIQVKDLKPGTTTDLGVIRVFVEPQVTIEVRNEKGNPVPFCGVNIQLATERDASSVIPYFTDSKGRLTIALPDGEYVLNASGPALENTAYQSRGDYRLTVQQGKVQAPQPVVLNVTATRMTRVQQVKMRVRTSRNQTPKRLWTPFGGVVFEDAERTWRPYRIDGDMLTIQLGSDRTNRLVIVDFGTQEGAVLRNLSARNAPKVVRLQPLPAVSGLVLDPAGKAVAGARVTLMFGQETVYPSSDGAAQRMWEEFLTPFSTSTDRMGRFVLPLLPEGRCWAIVTAKGYEPAALMLKKGQSPTFRLKRATAEYTGVLVDDYGEPIARASLTLKYRFADARTPKNYQRRVVPTRSISLGNVTTDDAGRFSLKEMPSSLLLALRVQDMPLAEMSVKPSRDLVLTFSTTRPPWESDRQPSPPDVEKLLRRVQWLQPVQWEGKNTLLVLTAPYLAQNQRLLQAIKPHLPDGWQVAIVLDTTSRQEVERYGKQSQLDAPVGYWKRSPQRPALPVLSQILPALPYVVYIGQDGKPQRQGIAVDELPKLFGALP